MVRPFIATGTSWVSIGGPISAANQRGAGERSSSRDGRDGSEIATPAASHGAQLHRQGPEQLLGRNALLDQLHGFAHHQLSEPHRRSDLDARCRARFEDGDAAGNQGRNPIDCDEHDEKLHPHRAAEPQGIEQPRAPRRRRPDSHVSWSANDVLPERLLNAQREAEHR
jgi:hypothetical protein